MNEAQIKQECEKAFERTGMSKGVVADYLHTTATNVSNWLSDQRSFPKDRLLEVAKVLNDFEFTFKVIEYTTDIKLIPDTDIQAPLQNDWFMSKKEENERKELENDKWLAYMGKSYKEWDIEAYRTFLHYRKELSEEVQRELVFLQKATQLLDEVRRINNFKIEEVQL